MTHPIESWWPKLPERIRLELATDPTAPLSADAAEAIMRAASMGPSYVYWEGQPPAPAYLTDAEAEWISQQPIDDLEDDAEQMALDAIDDALGDFPREI